MKVCLVEPSKFVSLTNFVSTISMPPIGLAYIAAALREAGHKVSVVDGPGSAPRNFFQFRGGHQSALAEILELDNVTLGRHVDRLETTGWLEDEVLDRPLPGRVYRALRGRAQREAAQGEGD